MRQGAQEREPLAIKNPDRGWVVAELDKLIGEWRAWQKDVQAIEDHPFDRMTQTEVYADGEENLKKHRILQEKTLTFLENNISGHGFIYGREGDKIDRTDLRLRIRVKHRIDDLDELRASLDYSLGMQAESSLPVRRLVAIVAMDVVGYSKLTEADENGTLARLGKIRSGVIDPAVARGRGRIFHTAGDSVLAEFSSSVDALFHAREIQATISARNATVAEAERLQFRIGIHQGDVVAQGDDLLGDTVNIAARIEGTAEPGGICVSDRVQHDTQGKVDVTFEDMGEPELKNITRPIRVYRIRPSASPTTAQGSTVDLIGLGPDVVCEGELISFAADEWEFRLRRFLIGEIADLVRFTDQFENISPNDRYVVVNTLGDGRQLAGPPSFAKSGGEYIATCHVLPKFPRISAYDLGSNMAISETTGDLFVKNGQIARVSGLEALPQKIRTSLSLLKGESPFHPDYGARLAEYYYAYRDRPWLNALLMLEVVRQAAIPYYDDVMNREYTPLHCIDRVWSVEPLANEPKDRWLPFRFDVQVAGVGRQEIKVPVLIIDPSVVRRAKEERGPKGPNSFPIGRSRDKRRQEK